MAAPDKNRRFKNGDICLESIRLLCIPLSNYLNVDLQSIDTNFGEITFFEAKKVEQIRKAKAFTGQGKKYK